MSDETEAPAEGADTEALPLDGEASDDTEAGSTETETAPAEKPPERPKFDLDAAIKEDRAWRETRKAQEVELANRRKALDDEAKKFEPLAPMLEHLPKVDQAGVLKAVSALANGDKIGAAVALFGLDPDFVSKLADHVGDNFLPKELTPEDVKRQVDETIARREEARAKADEEAATKRAEEEKAAFDTELEGYVATTAQVLKTPAFSERFPLCSSWAHRLPVARIKAEVERRVKAGESVAIVDVLPMFEKEFDEDIGRTPYGRRATAAAGNFDERFAEEEARFFGEEAAPAKKPVIVVREGGQVPKAPPPRARSAMDEIEVELQALEADHKRKAVY